ncbi:uncharacterized protein BKCO1_2000085 [Diplodia corticola]|uniref:Uncharacterized protein n=1 Tax=Diplodia corticola TaxID=236234 RepID=A0A1J9S303_9PEZI|nr:uncharacterized protein BKCO1_2000085 [Diplodia corticola]OJD34935.1 hypothetical protein BKCO1_2000085 [Diplodia corticola]
MPVPVFEKIRRDPDDDDDHDDHDDEYRESVADAWEEVTSLPAVVTIMGTHLTLDSTGMPFGLNTKRPPDFLTTATTAKTTPAPSSVQSTSIEITQSTSVAVSRPSEVGSGPNAASSATHGAPTSTTASDPVANNASSAASTSCATSSAVDGLPNGAAWPSSTSGFNENNGGVTMPSDPNPDNNQANSGGGTPLGLILAGVIIPILVVSLLAFAAFVVMRRRRQRNAQPTLAQEEMKLRPGSSGDDDYHPPPVAVIPVGSSPPPMIREPSPPQTAAAAAAATPPRAVTPVPAPPPVIVSAMNPANNSSYFTGIDTSEALSIRTNSVRSSGPPQRPAGFMLDGEFHEEPPPPYRPRSVPPISRDSSMRTANYRGVADCAGSIRLANDHHESPQHNPFADPSDDGISVMSEAPMNPFMRDDEDRLSVVSDMSYQQEPVTVHQGV